MLARIAGAAIGLLAGKGSLLQRFEGLMQFLSKHSERARGPKLLVLADFRVVAWVDTTSKTAFHGRNGLRDTRRRTPICET